MVGRLSDVVGRDLGRLLLGTGPEDLKETNNAQLATYTLSLMALDAVRRGPLAGLAPESLTALAGHSLGEYTALAAAGAVSAEEGAALVKVRGEAMQSAAAMTPGTMAAVIGLDLEEVAGAVEGLDGVWLANDNAPGQVVVAGAPEGVEAAGRAAAGRGAKRVIPLQVGGAFHSPLMAPAQEPLDRALAGATFTPPRRPVVANVDAEAHFEGFPALLSAQLCSRVRWRESLVALAGRGARLFVEIGPGTELSGMVKRTVPDARRANVAGPADLEGLGQLLTEVGLAVD
jgi:[acyl-carrier-protein] S-malonyltransferase